VRATQVIPGLAAALLWMGGFSQLLGFPIAWLRVRKTDGWRSRPPGVRRIDLLARFVRPATRTMLAWTVPVFAASWIGAVIGWPGVTVGAVIVLATSPFLIVPWIVIEADVDDLPDLAAELGDER
jgi:hypothetical protein